MDSKANEPIAVECVTDRQRFPYLWGFLVLMAIVLSIGSLAQCDKLQGDDRSATVDGDIRAECVLMRGDSLGELLGFPRADFRPRAVYVVGRIYNRTAKTAYITAEVSVPDLWPGITSTVKTEMVAPREKYAEPFVVKLQNDVEPDVRIDNQSVVVRVVSARYK